MYQSVLHLSLAISFYNLQQKEKIGKRLKEAGKAKKVTGKRKNAGTMQDKKKMQVKQKNAGKAVK